MTRRNFRVSSRVREINDILNFRGDISPFLVHLTRDMEERVFAHDVLLRIIEQRRLVAGSSMISDARFGTTTLILEPEKQCRYFGAVCFTETPLNEVHCMLEIKYRRVNLKPYGLVFLKQRIKRRGVGPVFYLNNEMGDKDQTVRTLCDLIGTNDDVAALVLPMVAVFGRHITARGADPQTGEIDFAWEREWRLPSALGPLEFTHEDVFVGLCRDDQIDEFENVFQPIGFVDPMRNMKWYATKLIEARQRFDLKASVV